MSVKRTGQLGFGEVALARRSGSAALERVSALVDWTGFERTLAGLREEGPGRPGYRPLLLFKALLLQAWYGLSDAELEFRLGDSLAFGRFVGLSLEDEVPDHTTLCRFRNRLVRDRLLERLFAELDGQLEGAGVVLKQGTMLDATLIETQAAGRRGPGEARVDPDAAYARRSGKPGSTHGYKAHVGVDQGSGLIRSILTTPANVNDTTPADALVRGDERAVLGDAAYHTHARQAALKAQGIKPRLMRRPNKHHPTLPPRLARLNRLIARRRAAVETTFATWKRRMGLTGIRYIGLTKASGQMLMVAMAFNLRRWAALQPA
ncbi:IS5 family transposase [Brevundimonas sp. SL130]|uniref:IS5 family transposase n=1 Tax=Brevundimonas sp. SL130 TaxID=2995143 RepID=UPI00226CB5CB|nr:IS5 family transposase [Brevundimonas sp. SL130]WAC59429.1 IS5 family transposase [Brevundimonas sp. SL130]WAC59587.1 IS5 family transposase [Brevundimonas sp. SL130]WAC60466.1 IS5 family transposase [Brevundimonas sp. SL130]